MYLWSQGLTCIYHAMESHYDMYLWSHGLTCIYHAMESRTDRYRSRSETVSKPFAVMLAVEMCLASVCRSRGTQEGYILTVACQHVFSQAFVKRNVTSQQSSYFWVEPSSSVQFSQVLFLPCLSSPSLSLSLSRNYRASKIIFEGKSLKIIPYLLTAMYIIALLRASIGPDLVFHFTKHLLDGQTGCLSVYPCIHPPIQ